MEKSDVELEVKNRYKEFIKDCQPTEIEMNSCPGLFSA